MNLEHLITNETKAIRNSIREFVNGEIMPLRGQLEDDYSLVEGIHQKLVDIGIQEGGYPAEYGGTGRGVDQIPEPDRPVLTARGQDWFGGTERYCQNPAFVTPEHRRFSGRVGYIPQPDALVKTGRSQGPAVRTEGHRAHAGLVAAQNYRLDRRAAQVPQLNDSIGAGGGQLLAACRPSGNRTERD